MVSRSKYKKVTDLYVQGTEVVLKDESVIWVQALNPFEYQEAQQQASAARSRVVLAMKEIGSDEFLRFKAQAAEMPREEKVKNLAQRQAQDALTNILSGIEADDDWAEVIQVLERSDDLQTGTEEERELIAKKNHEYLEEVQRRGNLERENREAVLSAEPDEELDRLLADAYVEHVAGERAMTEFEAVEVLKGARACDATPRDDGTWDHSACEGHRLTAFEDLNEVRTLPEELYASIRAGFAAINVPPMEVKGSGSEASSSEPSSVPSEQVASEPSSPEEASKSAPGTSTSPSTTP